MEERARLCPRSRRYVRRPNASIRNEYETSTQSQALTNSGIRVLTVPEAATILFSNGFKSSDPLHIQGAIMKLQISLEDLFEGIARDFEGRSVLLCDRGLMDGKGVDKNVAQF